MIVLAFDTATADHRRWRADGGARRPVEPRDEPAARRAPRPRRQHLLTLCRERALDADGPRTEPQVRSHRRRRRAGHVHRPAHRRRDRPRAGAVGRGRNLVAAVFALLARAAVAATSRGSPSRCDRRAPWRDLRASSTASRPQHRFFSRPRSSTRAGRAGPGTAVDRRRRAAVRLGLLRGGRGRPRELQPRSTVSPPPAVRRLAAACRRRSGGTGCCRTTCASPTRATGMTTARHPPPHLRRPPAGRRHRAPRVPHTVVAGDVRARALQAQRRLPRRARGRRRRRLPRSARATTPSGTS